MIIILIAIAAYFLLNSKKTITKTQNLIHNATNIKNVPQIIPIGSLQEPPASILPIIKKKKSEAQLNCEKFSGIWINGQCRHMPIP